MSHKDLTEISAANFPALRSFLRGYFHEDLADEYGTPEEAADAFCEDAETEERLTVAREWVRFIELVHGRSTSEINRLLTTKLGSATQLNEEEMEKVSAIFARYLKTKTRNRPVEETE
jgi:CdiI immunity protein